MAITPYYLTLIDPDNPDCPIKKQAVPGVEELIQGKNDLLDPLDEDVDSPVPGLTHRYPDRVLFLITDMCSMYCRHCTRRRFAGQKDMPAPKQRIDQAIEYIARTPAIRDVLLSGGDALLMEDEVLEDIIARIRAIDHTRLSESAFRTPVVMPQRITDSPVNMLKSIIRFGSTPISIIMMKSPLKVAKPSRIGQCRYSFRNQSVAQGANDWSTS